jgi:hypothetical protein
MGGMQVVEYRVQMPGRRLQGDNRGCTQISQDDEVLSAGDVSAPFNGIPGILSSPPGAQVEVQLHHLLAVIFNSSVQQFHLCKDR